MFVWSDVKVIFITGFDTSIVIPSPVLISIVSPLVFLTLKLYDTIPSLCNAELTSNEASQLLPLVLLMSMIASDTWAPEISNVIVGGSCIVSLDANVNLTVSLVFANVSITLVVVKVIPDKAFSIVTPLPSIVYCVPSSV